MSMSLAHLWDRTTSSGAQYPAPPGAHGVENTDDGPLAEVIPLPVGEQNRRTRRSWRRLTGSEAGMATAEYAIATLAAVAFAGLLVLILRSGEVRGMLMGLVELALTAV